LATILHYKAYNICGILEDWTGIPESTGWIPLRRMVRASRKEMLSTASITA